MAKQLLMGNEAMAYAALEAGVRVAAGYPGTPSSEIIETIGRLHASGAAKGVHVEWSTNEKAALELLGGASMAGARCLFTCKQMGLNVASDPLMCLNYVGVRGGLVLIVADDPGPISSQTEQDTRRFAAFAKVPVLDPATPEQAYEMVKAAFDLSERIQAPVIVRPTTRVDHASAFFDVPEQTEAREVPNGGFEHDPDKWVIFPRRSYAAHADINARLPQVASMFSEEYPWVAFNQVEEYGSAQIVAPAPAGQGGAHRHAAPRTLALGIVAGGVSAAYVREALRIVADSAEMAGVELPACRFMQIGTPYPFPEQAFARFAEGLTDIMVIEELDYVLEDELLRFAGRTHAAYAVHGKLTGEALDRGENDVDDIAARIAAFLDTKAIRPEVAEQDEALEAEDDAEEFEEGFFYEGDLPIRPPVLCPGCPHRGSFYAVKKALGSTPAVLCGDIGCYTLGNAKPLDAVDTCLCMGAGVTMAQGLAIADPDKKAVAFIGDSTFFASGMPGLANAAYNGHDITVVVLDNATTAMTGGQPHPGTGITLMGENRKPLSIAAVLNANGFSRVFRADPLDKDASIVAAKAAIAYKGPSAIIFSSPCVQLRKPDEPVHVDRAACIGCRRCITEIGCPAISFDPLVRGPKSGSRGQAVVDPSQCNGCGLCTQVCTLQAIVPAEGARSAAGVVAAGTAEAAIAAQRVSEVRPSATGMIDKVVSWREACRADEVEGAEEVEAAEAEAAAAAVDAEEVAEAAEAVDAEEAATAEAATATEEAAEEVIGDESAEAAVEADADVIEEDFADDDAEIIEDDADEAAADEVVDEIDDFEIIVVGGPKEPESDDAKKAVDEDDFEIIVVGAPEEPEAEDEAEPEDTDEPEIEEPLADEEAEAEEPEEAVEVDEPEEPEELEEPEESEESDEDFELEEAEELEEPEEPAELEDSGEFEENEEPEESDETDEPDDADETGETEESDEAEPNQPVGDTELMEPVDDEYGYGSADEFIYEEDGQIYEPVENGYSGSEVFLDIPFDDESFVQKDWYSWKRGGSRG